MARQLDDTLTRVAEECFESLVFMFLMSEDEEEAGGGEMALAARVNFSGPFDGMVVVAASQQLLAPLAANMLGLEDETQTTVEHRHDALKEMANVICGNMLPALAGTKPIFKVHAPEIAADLPQGDMADRPPTASALLNLDEGSARITLYVDAPDEEVAAAFAQRVR